jgi:MFS family permease
MIDKLKEKKVMMLAFLVAFLGSLLLALYPNYISAVASLFLIGCGMAMLQVVINPLLRTSGGEENYAFYSVAAQLVFGLASFISPLVYSGLVREMKSNTSDNFFVEFLNRKIPAGLPWISLYYVFVVICVFMILVIAVSKFPKVELNEDEKPGALEVHLKLLKNKFVVLFFIGMICYVGTEQGVANWISQFLSTYHGLDPQTDGANTVAYFWGLMTAGGVLGMLLIKLLDSRTVLISFTLLAMVSLLFALYGSAATALIAFPLVGFFASVIYPIIFSLSLNTITEHHGSFSGILVTGIIGGAILPLIVGWLGDLIGLKLAMCFLFIPLGFIFSIGFWAKPIIANKTISLFKKKSSEG